MRTVAIFIAILTSGCAPELVQNSPAGGMVQLGDVLQGREEAIEMANAECAKHGREARVTRIDELSNTLAYECEPTAHRAE